MAADKKFHCCQKIIFLTCSPVTFLPVVVFTSGDLFALEPETCRPEAEVGPQAAAVPPVAVGLLPVGVVEIALPVSLYTV